MSHSVCIISPSLRLGGIERSLVILADFFVESGFIVYFIPCLSGTQFYNLNEKVKIVRPGFKHSGGWMSKLSFYPKICWFIRKYVRQTNPEVVLTFGDLFSSLVLLALLGLNKRVFISDRTSPYYNLSFPIPTLKKWLYPKSAGFIAQTSLACRFNREKFRRRLNMTIIPNAMREVKLYPQIPRENIILYAGRFSSEKSPERLIKAFSIIPDRQDWQLHMAGSGPLLNSMKKFVSALGIRDKVVFYGEVSDVDRLYAKAGIFVLSSLFEGFPNSLCEAMAAGLPCICFNNIPYDEIFTDGYDGIAVKEGDDIKGLASALMLLMHNKALREEIGRRAMEIRKRLSIDIIGPRITEFIFNS